MSPGVFFSSSSIFPWRKKVRRNKIVIHRQDNMRDMEDDEEAFASIRIKTAKLRDRQSTKWPVALIEKAYSSEIFTRTNCPTFESAKDNYFLRCVVMHRSIFKPSRFFFLPRSPNEYISLITSIHDSMKISIRREDVKSTHESYSRRVWINAMPFTWLRAVLPGRVDSRSADRW